MAKRSALADLSDRDLLERLGEHKQELFNLRFQNVTGQLDNYARLRQVKRDIARVNTELRAREIAAAEALAQEEMA
ncbi:MAG: 50S ribosomal protein L29 [Acidimicrobiales bacterium]|nr:50S ribosomal protein L29 [Acidimicrobiales bacterium]